MFEEFHSKLRPGVSIAWEDGNKCALLMEFPSPPRSNFHAYYCGYVSLDASMFEDIDLKELEGEISVHGGCTYMEREREIRSYSGSIVHMDGI